MADSIITRAEAQSRGLKRYFTGKPCVRGHVVKRSIKGACTECSRTDSREARRVLRSTDQGRKYANKRQVEYNRRLTKPKPTRPEPTTCECCGLSPRGKHSMHLDHDHNTGAFRGWLCSNCNTGIGLLGDKWDSVFNALAYLARSA